MAHYKCYIESDSTAVSVTGTGVISDPYIGDGEAVIQHALDQFGTGWGPSPASSWALGDIVEIYGSNKEKYDFTGVVTPGTNWTGNDGNGKALYYRVWETTSEAAGGTFITWPSGEKMACWELDGLGSAAEPIRSNVTNTGFYGFKIHDFSSYGLRGGARTVERCEFYNISTITALDATVGQVTGCWFHDPGSSVNAIERATNIIGCLIEGPWEYAFETAGLAMGNVIYLYGADNLEGCQWAAGDNAAVAFNSFISDGSAGHRGVHYSLSGAQSNSVLYNTFVNFSGTGATWVRKSSAVNDICSVAGNRTFQCNAPVDDGTMSQFTQHRYENNDALSEHPLFNPAGYDFRPLVQAFQSHSLSDFPLPNMMFPCAPLHVVDDSHIYTAAGINKPWARTTLPTDDV